MKIGGILIAVLLSWNVVFSQELQWTPIAPPSIESHGLAERYVEPDRIYVSINIGEERDRNDEDPIELKERTLMEGLIAKGIPKDRILLKDAIIRYQQINWFKRKQVDNREYVLELHNALEVQKSFEVLDKLKIHNARITKLEFSKKDSLISVLRIEAAGKAKAKSAKLLTAIDENLGKIMEAREHHSGGDITVRGSRGNQTNYYIDGIRVSGKMGGQIDENNIAVGMLSKLYFAQGIYLKYQIE